METRRTRRSLKENKKRMRSHIAAVLSYRLIGLLYLLLTGTVFAFVIIMAINYVTNLYNLSESTTYSLLLIGAVVDLLLVGMLAYPAKKLFYNFLCKVSKSK